MTPQAQPQGGPDTDGVYPAPDHLEPGRAWFDVDLDTQGGSGDLARILTLLAMYGITPHRLTAHADGPGLRVAMRLRADGRICAQFVSRARALFAVLQIHCAPAGDAK